MAAVGGSLIAAGLAVSRGDDERGWPGCGDDERDGSQELARDAWWIDRSPQSTAAAAFIEATSAVSPCKR